MAAPILATLALVHGVHGANLSDFAPAPHTNDETENWHMTRTYLDVGFSGGNYSIDERTAPAGPSFGIYGPVFPVAYGTLGRIFGYGLASAPLFHLGLIAAAILTFLLVTGIDRPGTVLVGALCATFCPLLRFVQTNMQEGLHYALAIALAGLFVRVIRDRRAHGAIVVCAVLLVFASALRITWAVLLFPFAYLASEGRGRSVRGAALGAAALTAGAVWLLNGYFSVPFEGTWSPSTVTDDPARLARVWVERTLANLRAIVSPGATALETGQRLQVVVLLVALAIERVRARRLPAPVLHFVNLGGIAALILPLYIVGNYGDYRLLSVHLLFSALILAAFRDGWGRALALVVLGLELCMLPAFLVEYERWRPAYDGTYRRAIESLRTQVGDDVAYRSSPDRWCNTLAVYYEPPLEYPVDLAGLPSGIGVATLLQVEDVAPRSRYLLMTPERYARLAPRGRIERRREIETSAGPAVLCLNLDRACD